ncbi:hypothetical protein [Bradyrhizobium sp. USDA 4452]
MSPDLGGGKRADLLRETLEKAAGRPIGKALVGALANSVIDRIIGTDSVPPFRLSPGPVLAKLETVSAVPFLAETIRRLHHGEALADLMPYQA